MGHQSADRPAKGWGLRFIEAGGKEWQLMQIAPGPQLTLLSEGVMHMTVPPFAIPAGVEWEPFETTAGVRYGSKQGAQKIADVLASTAASSGGS